MNVGVYYYFYRKSRSIFKKKRYSLILVSLFLLIQATPLSLYRLGYITTSDPFGYGWVFLGYSCLSFFSYFLVSFFIFDMSIFAFIKIKKKESDEISIERRNFIKGIISKGIFAGSIGAATTGAIKARQTPKVKKMNLVSKRKSSSKEETIKFVQISDLHVGPTIREHLIEGIIKEIKELSPDILFLTGDLIDGIPDEKMMNVLKPFGDLEVPFGKYFVSGNHEFYWGIERWKKAYLSLGLQDLDNANKVLHIKNKKILLTGIQDRTRRFFRKEKIELEDIIDKAPTDDFNYKIFVNHRPERYGIAERNGYDLQLSGHTHGGQFFPWNLVINMIYRYPKGLYDHKRMKIYVNPGTGYWGPPNRLGVPNEVTFFSLKC
jgi:predicted MPP superfamily phosphohydrolase